MIDYSFEVFSLYSALSENNLNNVVKRATWKITAKEDQYAVDRYFDSLFVSPEPNAFIDYDNLSMETVIEWVKGPINLDQLYADMAADLEKAKDPSRIVEKPLPWGFENFYHVSDMYVLVHNDEVIYGPVHWHSDIMNGHLSNLGIQYNFPDDITARRRRLVPLNTPTVISETTKAYKVSLLNNQSEESLFTVNGNIVWDFSSGIAVGTYVAVDKELDEVKKLLLETIERNRNNKEMSGLTVTLDNEEYKILSGPISRLNLLEKNNLMQENDTCVWKFMDNKWATVNKTQVIYLYNAILDFVKNLQQWEYDRTLEIHNAETVDQLRTVSLEV